MVTAYQQVADLKSQRDSNMRTEVFNPIKDTTLKELVNIQVCLLPHVSISNKFLRC